MKKKEAARRNEYLETMIQKNENGEIELSMGQVKVLRAYLGFRDSEKVALEFNGLGGFFESELEDAYKLLRDAKIHNFRLFDSSTELMKIIHYFIGKRFDIELVEKVDSFGRVEKGLRFYR